MKPKYSCKSDGNTGICFFLAFGFHGDLGGFISRALCLFPELPDTVEPVHVTRVFYVENKNMTKKSSLLSLNFEFCRQLITLFLYTSLRSVWSLSNNLTKYSSIVVQKSGLKPASIIHTKIDTAFQQSSTFLIKRSGMEMTIVQACTVTAL